MVQGEGEGVGLHSQEVCVDTRTYQFAKNTSNLVHNS